MLTGTNSRNDYIGNGSTATYAYTFRIFTDSDLLVVQRDTLGVETTLTLNVDYTVTGAGDVTGGNVVLGSNLTTGYTLTIRRVRPLTQQKDLRNLGASFPATYEDGLDHGLMIAQQQQDEIDRSLKLAETVAASGFDTEFPTPVANKFMRINAAADGMELADLQASGTFAFPAGTGLLSKDGASTSVARSIQAGDGISVADGDGVSGDPTITNSDHADYLVTKLDVERMRPGFIRNLLLVYSTPTVVVINGGRCFSQESGGLYYEMNTSVALPVDLTASGANGLDTGAMAGNSWYYIYVIKNLSTGTVAGLASLSDATPTLPAGYTAQRLIGAVRTDATPNIIPFYCRGYNAERKFYWPTRISLLGTGYVGAVAATLVSITPAAPTSVTLGAIYLSCEAQAQGAAGSGASLLVGPTATPNMVYLRPLVQVVGVNSPVDSTYIEVPNTFIANTLYYQTSLGAGATAVNSYIYCTAFELEL